MISLAKTGLWTLTALLADPATAAIDSGVGAPPVMVAPHGLPPILPRPQATSVSDERLDRGHDASEVRDAYRRPDYGFQLPSYWMTPEYFVFDLEYYDLPEPAEGFGWSRYYDDVVLTDRWGRVYDSRGGIEWNRRFARDDRRYRTHRYRRSGAHWGGAYFQSAYGCACGAETIVTTTVTFNAAPAADRTVTTYETEYVRTPAAKRPTSKKRLRSNPRPILGS